MSPHPGRTNNAAGASGAQGVNGHTAPPTDPIHALDLVAARTKVKGSQMHALEKKEASADDQDKEQPTQEELMVVWMQKGGKAASKGGGGGKAGTDQSWPIW